MVAPMSPAMTPSRRCREVAVVVVLLVERSRVSPDLYHRSPREGNPERSVQALRSKCTTSSHQGRAPAVKSFRGRIGTIDATSAGEPDVQRARGESLPLSPFLIVPGFHFSRRLLLAVEDLGHKQEDREQIHVPHRPHDPSTQGLIIER